MEATRALRPYNISHRSGLPRTTENQLSRQRYSFWLRFSLPLTPSTHSTMGCCSSKEPSSQPAARPRQIGAPQDVVIHVPRNRLDYHGAPVAKSYAEIPRANLVEALSLMGQYLAQRNANITAIAVGGAVNTILLRSRQATHDVDIFGSGLDNNARILLDDAMQYAQRGSRSNLGTDWFNTETTMWMSPGMHRTLTAEAMHQGVVVFRHAGLTLLAAPWNYAFSAKVSRLTTDAGAMARPYDLEDAIIYLNEMVGQNNGRPIRLQHLLQRAEHYHHNTSRTFLMNRVNQEYQRRYNRSGIVA
jgi:hypothetical protein